MDDIRQIRIELCKMNCRVHMKTAEILRIGDSLEYHTCCEDFKKRLEVRHAELLAEPTKKLRLAR